MKSNRVNFTKEQEASIFHRSGSLLVSAAAGSGKTKVLVERLLSHVEEGADIDEFLVITYTRAAAFELKERVHDELLTKLSYSPGNKRLRRQTLLCAGASIDTIHTICGEILRENSYLVKLPVDFRIADTSESLMIMNETADSLINGIYDNIDQYPGFKLLIDTVAGIRDDKLLTELIIDIYNKIRSLPNPGGWLRGQIEKQKFTDITDVSETDSGDYILRKLKYTAGFLKSEMNRLLDEMEAHPEFKEKYHDSACEILEQIITFEAALLDGWDEARNACLFEFNRAKGISGYDELKDIRKNCIAELKKCAEELKICSEEHIKEMIGLSPAITELLNILIMFDDLYTQEKRRKGIADFSDLEHLTLSLLIDEATGEKTELAHTLSMRYKEIMIDEYQDVNAVQEMIFNAISKSKQNIFMVGDVKQAIYRFRHADPSIFLSKYKTFSSAQSHTGTKIHLSQNFRSEKGILEAVNHIFRNIMSVDIGELDYTEKEWLIPGREDTINKKGKQGKPYINNNTSPSVLIDLLDMSTVESDSDEESPTSIKIEAEYIASQIAKLTDGSFLIPDNESGQRPAALSDIVILLRSMKGRAWQYASALSERGIASEFPGGEGYFETIEVSAVMSLLSVIDNPIQDIPLAAVLSGIIYRFSSDELAEVRSVTSGTDYYDALKKAGEHDMCSRETRLKCKKILKDIYDFQEIVNEFTADKFIWHVYNKTGILEIAGSMKGGEKRRQNLILLAESARQFEKSGYKGLFGFLNYIRSLQEREESLPMWTDDKSSKSSPIDAVRIMSIHKSKGLEFPIVFLSNCSKRFNLIDSSKSTVFHSDLGIGTMLVNKKLRIKYSTMVRNAIKYKLRDEMFSEELRVMYVAMTRAREKLIITASLKDTEKELAKINNLPQGKIAPFTLMSMKSTIEWILAGVRDIDRKHAILNTIDLTSALPVTKTEILIKHSQTKEDSEKADNLDETYEKEDYIYPYNNAINLPSKLTVTDLVNLFDNETGKASWLKDESNLQDFNTSPGFIIEKKQMSGAERGTLLHLIMQHIDYNKCSYDGDTSKELQRLCYMGIISEEQVKEIDKTQIHKFIDSDLGGRLINAEIVKKEFKFSILSPAKKYFPEGSDDLILVQGVVDCFFEENNEIIIIDFKSDKVDKNTIEEKIKKYTPQLEAYADALTRITGKKVKECFIYFFDADTAHAIKTSSREY